MSASMKNSSHTYRGKVKKKGKQYKCNFCEKVFDKHQALGGHQRSHQNLIKQLIEQNHAIPPNIPMDVTQSSLEHGNSSGDLSKGNNNEPLTTSIHQSNNGTMPSAVTVVDSVNVTNSNLKDGNGQMIILPAGPKNTPDAFTGNHYDSYTQGNNASLVAPLQSDGTMPFALFMGHPIYSNPIGSTSSASLIPSHQFNADNSQSSIGYHMNGFSQSMGPNLFPGADTNKGLSLSTKDANLKDGHASLPEAPSTCGSVLESTNYAKEENWIDLDLSLHL